MEKIIISKNLLEKEYIEKDKSGRQVAKFFGVNKHIIYKHLKEYNIPKRTAPCKRNYYCKEKDCNNKILYDTWKRGTGRCYKCSIKQLRGVNSPKWISGKHKDIRGYVHVFMPNAIRRKRKYILEHRLVMEKHLGRYLKPKEVVHHINSILDDNRIENLMLFKNNSEHKKHHDKIRKSKNN